MANWEDVAKRGGTVSPTGYVRPEAYMPSKPSVSTPNAPAEEDLYSYGGGGDYFGNIEPYLAPKPEAETPSYRKVSTPSYSTTSTSFTPSRERPEYGDIPAYGMPERDEERISELREKAMGVPMSRLRRALNRALVESRYSTNPIVRAQARKQALAGYGQGIGEIGTAAGREARAEYAPEYQAQIAKTAAEYGAKLNKQKTEYMADLEDYYKTGTQKQTTSSRSTNWVINPSFRS